MRCARPLIQIICAGLRCTGGRTSQDYARRHLLSLLQWFAKLSRDERPGLEVSPLSRGVMYPFDCSHGALSKFNPYPPHYRKAFASSTILYPQALRLTLRFAFPCGKSTGRPTGLPRSMQVPAQVRFRLSAGGSTSAMGELGAPILDPLPFGPSLYALAGQVSTFGLSQITTFISGSHVLTILRNPSPRPPWC